VPAFTLTRFVATSGSSIGNKGRSLARSRFLALYRVIVRSLAKALVILFAWVGSTRSDRQPRAEE
jgi:hypothetical protein